MSKKSWSSLSVIAGIAIVAAGLMAGCGGGDSNDPDPQNINLSGTRWFADRTDGSKAIFDFRDATGVCMLTPSGDLMGCDKYAVQGSNFTFSIMMPNGSRFDVWGMETGATVMNGACTVTTAGVPATHDWVARKM